MRRAVLLVLLGAALGAGGMASAYFHDEEESVRVLAAYDFKEKLDGKDARATIVEVTLAPGQAEASHQHPGPAFVYVLEGKYELGVDDRPTKVFKAGETFHETTGALHRVSRNPSTKERTRLIAVVLHPRDAKEIVTPEKPKHEPR